MNNIINNYMIDILILIIEILSIAKCMLYYIFKQVQIFQILIILGFYISLSGKYFSLTELGLKAHGMTGFLKEILAKCKYLDMDS